MNPRILGKVANGPNAEQERRLAAGQPNLEAGETHGHPCRPLCPLPRHHGLARGPPYRLG
eukprot:4232174-Alexandrium_andersonii.AAC.1